MNLKKKLITCLCLILGAIAVVCSAVYVGLNVHAESSSGEVFDYSSSVQLKYKAAQSDSADPTQKGLLMYAYDSGAFAEFKAGINGSFSADVKALKNGNSVDLSKYSFVFTDKATGKSFSVIVTNKGSYNDVCVSVDGNNAGIYYYTTQYDTNGSAFGYTAQYNNSGTYTSVLSNEIQITFDPATMQVNVLGDGGAYHPVWDFSKEYNDGKQLKHDLPQFGEYTVKLVFDEVKSNGKGELLVYSFGGCSFDSAYMESKPSVFANVTANAVVGQEYRIPQASAVDLIAGELPAENVSVSVYDVYGNVLNQGEYRFTPDTEGEYYIYYSYQTDKDEAPVAVAFYRIVALSPADCAYRFTFDGEDVGGIGEIGTHKTVFIPKGIVESDLFISGTAEATVTIQKGGVPVEGYESIAGGFAYTFTETGDYSVVYQVSVNGMTLEDVKTITVSSDIPTYVMEEISEEIEFLSTIRVTPGKVYLGNTAQEMSVSVRYPSGKTVRGGECFLDELGTYIVTHEYNGKAYEQRFTVKQPYSHLFSGDFTSAEYGTLVGNNTIKGQILTLTNNNTVMFTRLIDLSDNTFNENLEDKSENTPLIEMFAQPHSLGITDVQGLYITITDKYDPNNYIIIRIKYLSYLPHNMRIRTMAAGQSWVGYDYNFWTGDISVDSAQSHEDGGTIVSFDCSQSVTGDQFENRKLRLYFDNTTGRLYTRTWQDTAGNSTASNYIPIPWLIRDYKTTDPTLSAGDTPWKGFTTGEVYLSIYATGVSDTADFLVTNIDGEDLTEKFYTDDVPPTISLDIDENDIPFAKVGKEFKVFDFIAEDAYSSVVESGVKVLHGGKEIALNGGVFVPQEVGTYTITYTAKDAFGNTTTKTVNVEAKNTLPKLNIEIDGELPEEIFFGQLIQLPTAIGSGGSGGITVTVQVTAVDADQNIEIKNGAFRCMQAGSYRIEYTARDYIGNVVSSSVWFDVSFSTAPIFNEESIVLPGAFIAGDVFVFFDYFATYYNGNGGTETVKAVITVKDADGTRTVTDGKYIPVASETIDTATITFSFTANGQTTSVVKKVPILTVKRGVGYLKNFFTTTNATVDAVNDAIVFTPVDDSIMKIAFAKAISQKYLTIGMKREDLGCFTVMNIILRDTSDPEATVKLTYRNQAGNLTLSINDGAACKANFDTNGNFAIKYDISTKRIFDVLGMEVGTITKYQNGSSFNGFPSGSVYLEIETDGKMAISSIANQNFNNYVRDSITPLLMVNGSFSGTYIPGQTITLPSATAYDVLSSVEDILVVVKSSSGETVASGTADKELSFTPQNYDTYSVVYSVLDSAGNKMMYSSSLVVVDNVKPTLSFDGSIPETARVGSSLTLPGYTVSDNGDLGKIVVKKYICGPDGIMLPVSTDGTVKFDTKGIYIVYYFVVDENDNTTNYAFTISVS